MNEPATSAASATVPRFTIQQHPKEKCNVRNNERNDSPIADHSRINQTGWAPNGRRFPTRRSPRC